MVALSVARCIEWHARNRPSEKAITCEGSISWWSLESRTNRLARAIEERCRLVESRIIVIHMSNSVALFEAGIAVLKLGGTPLPVSPKMPSVELRAVLKLVDPPLLIGAEAGTGALASPKCTLIPAGFEADHALSDQPLPDRVAGAFKACLSGGSTGERR